MWGMLIPPLIETGMRITDPGLLAELETLRGDGPGQKAFAQRIGAQHGMPDADFCFVDRANCDGSLVAYIGKHV